jgi:hypothetical protein
MTASSNPLTAYPDRSFASSKTPQRFKELASGRIDSSDQWMDSKQKIRMSHRLVLDYFDLYME